jgi:hypothetical protein
MNLPRTIPGAEDGKEASQCRRDQRLGESATPVVRTRSTAPTGADPLKTLLVTYDVHAPASVVGERTAATRGADLLTAAAELVWNASHQMTVHEVEDQLADPLESGLDQGKSKTIRRNSFHDTQELA